jgi:hypothetical protein
MGTGTSLATVASMCGDLQPLRAQLEQVVSTALPDGGEVWQVDFTLAVAPGVWTIVVEDVESLERLYDEILSSGNERFGSVEPSGDAAERPAAPDALLNDHEGAVFNLLSLIH